MIDHLYEGLEVCAWLFGGGAVGLIWVMEALRYDEDLFYSPVVGLLGWLSVLCALAGLIGAATIVGFILRSV